MKKKNNTKVNNDNNNRVQQASRFLMAHQHK